MSSGANPQGGAYGQVLVDAASRLAGPFAEDGRQPCPLGGHGIELRLRESPDGDLHQESRRRSGEPGGGPEVPTQQERCALSQGDQGAVDGVQLRIHRRVVDGKAAGDDRASIHTGTELVRSSQRILPTFGPSHDPESFDAQVFKQRDDVGPHPRDHSVAGQPIGPPGAGSVRRKDAQSEFLRMLIGGTDIVSTHQAAVAIQHHRTGRVPVDGVADGSPTCQ